MPVTWQLLTVSVEFSLVIQREIDAGTDADFQHALPRLELHPLNGLQAARVQRGPEEQVVDLGEFVVNAFDEIVLDRGN